MKRIFLYISSIIILLGCGKTEVPEEESISIISITANGIPLTDGTINIPLELNIQIAFSGQIIPEKLETNFSITRQGSPIGNLDFTYTNSTTKVTITALLEYNTQYRLKLAKAIVGENNTYLDQEIIRNFTSITEGIITFKDPCLSATNDCLEDIELISNGNPGSFSMYSSYPLEPDNARWESIKNAVITIHGLSRDGDAYFTSLATSLKSLSKQTETILMAPIFKAQNDASGNDLYWSDSGWREGDLSQGAISISSILVIEKILEKLGNEEVFPDLQQVIIAGHSSGALMTHLLATLLNPEDYSQKFNLQFVVANSQYFYYPKDVRFDPVQGNFQMVTGCPGYNNWPYGHNQFPAHLGGITENEAESNLIGNNVLYLLGTNDVVTTGTLNTTDCEAVLLGENRLKRGENMFRLIQTFYADLHQSEKILVNGIGHDSNGMFQSAEFKSWLTAILN